MYSQLDFYQDEIQSQWDGISSMQEHGLHIDTVALLEHRRNIRDSIEANNDSLAKLVNWRPNTKSNQEMEKLLLQISVKPNRTKPSRNFPLGQAKVARDDLLGYAHRFPNARAVLAICLEITRLRTLQSNFLGLALDDNNYYHPTYRLNGTATGRYASQGADEGGPQGQNWPHSLLNLVIPDRPGDILTEADLSQAEDRIIAWDSQDKIAIQAFESGVDSHRLKACWAFRNWDYPRGLPTNQMLASVTEVCTACASLGLHKCNHSERFISKTLGYAFKYMMGARKCVHKTLPEAGVYITEAEAKRIKARIVSPPMVSWQQQTDLELRRTRWLTNLLGRKREFYGIHDESGELLRAALSWKAQSVVGIVAGRAVSRLEKNLKLISSHCHLLTQRHDSVLLSHPPALGDTVRDALQNAFYSSINAHGRIFNIPVEIKSGPNWRDLN